ncbi:unnamed protein product, partial [Phaeothamnion confervicola]
RLVRLAASTVPAPHSATPAAVLAAVAAAPGTCLQVGEAVPKGGGGWGSGILTGPFVRGYQSIRRRANTETPSTLAAGPLALTAYALPGDGRRPPEILCAVLGTDWALRVYALESHRELCGLDLAPHAGSRGDRGGGGCLGGSLQGLPSSIFSVGEAALSAPTRRPVIAPGETLEAVLTMAAPPEGGARRGDGVADMLEEREGGRDSCGGGGGNGWSQKRELSLEFVATIAPKGAASRHFVCRFSATGGAAAFANTTLTLGAELSPPDDDVFLVDAAVDSAGTVWTLWRGGGGGGGEGGGDRMDGVVASA